MRMSKNKRTVIAIVVAVAMVLAVIIPAIWSVVHADPTANEQQRMDELRSQQQQARSSLTAATQERNQSLAELNRISGEVAAIQEQVRQTRAELTEIEGTLAERTAEYEDITRQADEQDEMFGEHLRVMLSSGPVTYFQAIARADNFYDLTRRVSTIRAIARHDNYILENMRDLQELIDESRREIEIVQANKQEVLERQQAQEAEHVRRQTEQNNFVQSLQRNVNAFRRAYDEARRQEETLIRQIQARLSAAGDGSVFIGGTFLWPVPGHNIGSGAGSRFGYRNHPVLGGRRFHSGIDIPAPSGTNILAANGGVVVFSAWNGGYGNCIIIDHGGGYSTLYAHNSVNLVRVGDQVYRGQVIARVGSTGMSTGPHLHFEVLRNGRAVDPMPYLGR